MEVFYLKINRHTPATWHYLKMWLDIAEQFPVFKIYIICDNPNLQTFVTNRIRQDVSDYDVEFITSARDSEELKYIVDNAIIPHWKAAAYAHLTTFLHARDNGYKNFWNIDADDIGLYAKSRKIAKLLKNVKDCAKEKSFLMLSLYIWRTTTQGGHWSFGVVYTDDAANVLELMKTHCKDSELFEKYGKVSCGLNLDCYCSYLKDAGAQGIETFYAENLRVIHDIINVYQNPTYGGIRYWKGGRLYFDLLCNAFGMGETGSLPVPKDILNFDCGITEIESINYLKNRCAAPAVTKLETVNGIIDSEITVILPLNGLGKICRSCLESLSEQNFKNFRVIVTDAGLDETALKICRDFESKFNGRMTIITGLSEENLLSEGLQAAKSSYVIFVNGNEYFLQEAFNFFHEVIVSTRADVVHTSNYFVPKGDTAIVKTDEIETDENSPTLKNLMRVKDKVHAWVDVNLSPSIFNKLIRREFLEEEKISLPFADNMTQWIFSLQCLMLAENYLHIKVSLYIRTAENSPHCNSVDQIKSLEKCYEALDNLDEEVFYFDKYADEKILIKNIFNKNFLNA